MNAHQNDFAVGSPIFSSPASVKNLDHRTERRNNESALLSVISSSSSFRSQTLLIADKWFSSALLFIVFSLFILTYTNERNSFLEFPSYPTVSTYWKKNGTVLILQNVGVSSKIYFTSTVQKFGNWLTIHLTSFVKPFLFKYSVRFTRLQKMAPIQFLARGKNYFWTNVL